MATGDTNSNEIRIRAKKISQLEKSSLSLYEYADKLYLLISYKPNDNENGQNFRLSVQDIINEIKENIEIPGSVIANQLINYFEGDNPTIETVKNILKQYLGSESAWETAQRLNKTGGAQTEESWYDLIISGRNNESEPTGPSEPIDDTVHVTGVTISSSSFSLSSGSTKQLSATISPSNATNKTVTWSSSNPSVATVSSNGLVTAKTVTASTDVVITVMTADGEFAATANVTVNPIISDVYHYLFSYAIKTNTNIFTVVNNAITGVNWTNLKALSYTQETVGQMPLSNGNGKGFYLSNYDTTYEGAFIWDSSVEDGELYIIVPSKYWDNSSKSFKDDNGGKWKITDAMMHNPINLSNLPIYTINNGYENQSYTCICVSEAGLMDEAYFKKIS